MAEYAIELNGFQTVDYHLFSTKEMKASAKLVWKGKKVADLIYTIEESSQPHVELDPSGWGRDELETAVDEILALMPLMEKEGRDPKRSAEIMGAFLIQLRTMQRKMQELHRNKPAPGLRYIGMFTGQETLLDSNEPDVIRADYLGRDETIADIYKLFDLSLEQMINFGGLKRCLAVYLTEADGGFPMRWTSVSFTNMYLWGQDINEAAAASKARSIAPAVQLCDLGLAHLERTGKFINVVLTWEGRPVASAYGLYSKGSFHIQVLDDDLRIPAHLREAYGELLREGYVAPLDEVNAKQIAAIFIDLLSVLGQLEKAFYLAKLGNPKADYILLYADRLDPGKNDCVQTAQFEASSEEMAQSMAKDHVEKKIRSGEMEVCSAFLLLSGNSIFPRSFTASGFLQIFRRAAELFGDCAGD